MPKRKQKHFGMIALLIFSCMLSMPGAEALGQLHTEAKAITMEEFSSLIEAQQQSKTVEVSSAEDLDSLRSFLQKKPTGRGNVFVQTRDIVVSPYSYQYQEESGRTAIYYEGKAEAYYDAKADVYYADPTTKTAISYTWKTESFAPIGTDCDSTDPSWSYEGNGYKIEGIYQNRLKRSAWKSAGIFYNAKKISGVFVKNYFGYGKNVTDLGALGGNLLSIEGCRGEDIELTLRHRGEDVAVGFVPYITGNITDTDVQADICVNNTEEESGCFGDVSVGIIAGGWSKKGMILNCSSSGHIENWNDLRGSVGGIAGSAAEISNCESNVKIGGMAATVGGIISCIAAGDVKNCVSRAQLCGNFQVAGGIAGSVPLHEYEVSDCRFEGSIRTDRSKSSYFNTDGTEALCYGGIIGNIPFTNEILIKGCINLGSVTMESSQSGAEISWGTGNKLGGIVGWIAGGEIVNCVNEGRLCNKQSAEQPVSGENTTVGGIAGYMKENSENSVLNCMNRGDVFNDNGSAGEIVGTMTGEDSEVCNIYAAGTASGNAVSNQVIGCEGKGVTRNCFTEESGGAGKLCVLLNQWIHDFDVTKEYHTIVTPGGDEFQPCVVENGVLTLQRKPVINPTPTKTPVKTLPPTVTPLVTQTPTRTPVASLQSTRTPPVTQAPTKTPASSKSPIPSVTKKPVQSAAPTVTPKQSMLPELTPVPSVSPTADITNTPVSFASAGETPSQNGLETVDQNTAKNQNTGKVTPSNGRKGLMAPVFTLKNRQNSRKQKYVQVTLEKYHGTYVEIRAKLKGQKYVRMKLKENRIKKLHGCIKFRYTVFGKRIYFKVRTYQIRKGKKIYSAVSAQKSIKTK